MVELDKPSQDHLETTKVDDENLEDLLSSSEKIKLRWKIDLRVVPMLALLFAVSLIDRINIGNAKVLGMTQDLKLVGSSYSICLLLFFPSYALFEIPHNMLLVKVGVRWWITFICAAWGLVMLGMGFVHNWPSLAVLRFFLGMFEAGIWPGTIFILSSWYPRYELQKRVSACYGVSLIGSAFGGVLAYALGLLGGQRDMKGWRWVFAIEGAISVVIALMAPLFLPDFPDRVKWLKPHEKIWVFSRLSNDRGSSETEAFTFKQVIHHAHSWTPWTMTGILFCNTVSNYALAFFIPTILQDLGYNGLQATLRSAPPYAAAIGALLLSAFLSDRFKIRTPFIIFFSCMCISGLAIAPPGLPAQVRYLGIHLAVMGGQVNQVAIITWSQNNIVGSSKRGFVAALNIAGSSLGGIVGSTVFRNQDAPGYAPGLYTTIGLQVVMIVCICGTTAAFHRKNKLADISDTVLEGVPGWRYTL